MLRMCYWLRMWQPIETAPKDGTEVLLWCSKFAGEVSGVVEKPGAVLGRFFSGMSDYGGVNWWDTGGDYYATWAWPTHWQPLPEPPAS